MHVVQKSSWATLKADPGDGCRQREGDKAGSEQDPQAPDNRPLEGRRAGLRSWALSVSQLKKQSEGACPHPTPLPTKGYLTSFSKFTLILKFCKNSFPRILSQSVGEEAVLEGLPLRPMIYNNPGSLQQSFGAEREKEKCPSSPPTLGPGGSTPLRKQGFWPESGCQATATAGQKGSL